MKITKYILLSLSILALNACNNYLDITPKGKAVIETVVDYNGLIEEPWPLYDPSNFSYLPIEQVHYVNSEVLDYKEPTISANFLWNEEFDRAEYNTKDPLYNACYKRIAKYNIVLDGIDEAKGGNEALKIKAKAQARILRAYNYFFLVNVYAKSYDPATAAKDRAIIVRDEFSIEELPGQSTVQEVYDFIEADIKAALPDLTDEKENVYRPGKAFAYAFKAKVHLYKGELEEAVEAAKKAMTYDGELWDLRDYIPVISPTYYLPLDTPECLMHGYCGGGYSPVAHVAPELADLFDPTDLRKDAFLTRKTPHPSAPEGILCFYVYNGIMWNSSGMRYSEVYLILAECYARLGKTAEAVAMINELREYRFPEGAVVKVSAANAEEARQIVVDERRMELMMTANTFFDMKRYTVIPEYRKTLTKTFEGKEYSLDPDSHLYIMPFSREALEGNPNLIQNSK